MHRIFCRDGKVFLVCLLVYWCRGLGNPKLVINEVVANTSCKFGITELKISAVHLFVLVEQKDTC